MYNAQLGLMVFNGYKKKKLAPTLWDGVSGSISAGGQSHLQSKNKVKLPHSCDLFVAIHVVLKWMKLPFVTRIIYSQT